MKGENIELDMKVKYNKKDSKFIKYGEVLIVDEILYTENEEGKRTYSIEFKNKRGFCLSPQDLNPVN